MRHDALLLVEDIQIAEAIYRDTTEPEKLREVTCPFVSDEETHAQVLNGTLQSHVSEALAFLMVKSVNSAELLAQIAAESRYPDAVRVSALERISNRIYFARALQAFNTEPGLENALSKQSFENIEWAIENSRLAPSLEILSIRTKWHPGITTVKPITLNILLNEILIKEL